MLGARGSESFETVRLPYVQKRREEGGGLQVARSGSFGVGGQLIFEAGGTGKQAALPLVVLGDKCAHHSRALLGQDPLMSRKKNCEGDEFGERKLTDWVTRESCRRHEPLDKLRACRQP